VQNTTIGIFISHHNFTKFTVTFTKEIYKLEGKEEENHRKKNKKQKIENTNHILHKGIYLPLFFYKENKI
jgi:hypothetical protein